MNTLPFRQLLSILLFFSISQVCFSQIWLEDFNSYADGTTQAPPKWTTIATDCDDGGNLNLGAGQSQWGVWNSKFTVNDIEGFPCCNGGLDGGGNDNSWLSEVIDLTGYCDISISMAVGADGVMECDAAGGPIFGCTGNTPPDNSHDQIVAEYNLDGGGWTQFGYICGDMGPSVITVLGLNGSNVQVRFFAANKSNSEYYYIEDIEVDGSPGTVPTFAPIGPLCELDPPTALPGVSIEGITGTWDVGSSFDPTGLGNTTTTINFTPNPGQCASTTTMDIAVDAEILLNPAPIGPFCTTDPPFALPTNVDGVNGNWSGIGVSNNNFSPGTAGGNVTITFTPDIGECASPADLMVDVNMPVSPVLGSASLCDIDPLFDLTTLQDPNYPSGTWAGNGVTGSSFNPMGLGGQVVNLTFTASASCTNVAATTITVTLAETPTLGTTSLCEDDGLYDLNNIIDPNFPLGTWSGPGVSGNFFNPNNQNGNVMVTFTSSTACVNPATTTIVVMPNTTPVLQETTVCQNSGLLDLTTLEDPLYPGGTWSGPGVTGTDFDPSNQIGPVVLTYTPNENCVNLGMTTITVEPQATPQLGTDNICESDGIYDLTQIQDPLYPNGTWSGDGVTGNMFDPVGQSGPVNLTFDPSGNCTFPASTIIIVSSAGTPQLGTATMCESDTIFNLVNIQDPQYPSGTWSGMGVSGSDFDPIDLAGNIALTFFPTGSCVDTATTFITVDSLGIPQLDTAEVCESSGIFNLNNIADPNFPVGTWSGSGVTGNNFDPAGLSGEIDLVFAPSANCALNDTTFIDVQSPAIPMLDSATLCQNNGLFDLTSLNDPNYTTGTWSGPAVSGNNFNPANQSGNVTVTFTPSANCTNEGNTIVNVSAAPTFSNQDENCDQQSQTFTVSFNISGGTPPYIVDGDTIMGNSYTSAPFPSGTNYSISLDDINGCGPVNVSGSANCNCATDAGTMDFSIAPLYICEGNSVSVEHLGDEFLDADDVLVFVMHDSAGTQLGNILITSDTTVIPFPNGAVVGTTYYISAVAGNNDGNGGIDISDICLSVSQGLPITYYELDAIFGPGDTICQNDCHLLDVTFIGVPPFDFISVILIDGGISEVRDTFVGHPSNSIQLNICPEDFGFEGGLLEVYLGEIADSNCATLSSDDSQLIFVTNQTEEDLSPTLCPGESVVINGTQYDENNPIGTETFINGGSNGCDSVVNINLSFHQPVIDSIIQTLCTGSSITVNGTVYDESNPSGTEVLAGASANGCDSSIVVNLNFNNEVFSNLNPTLCNGNFIIVNGTIYDTSNPSGSETFPNGSVLGCDSTVIINVAFFPPATNNFSQTLCSGGSIIINGTVYDENNPTGTEILPDASVNACDSIINVNLNFENEVSSNVTPLLCLNDSVIVNGTVYDFQNHTGTETIPNGSYLGCDSVIFVALDFYPPSFLIIEDEMCAGTSITVNGTVYDENNPIGQEWIIGSASTGCDSLVNIALSFIIEVFGNLDTTLCPGESITLNGTIYDENNPTGTETIIGGSQMGCDTVITVTLDFYPPAVNTIDDFLCPGGSIIVNGTLYDENNPFGSEVLPGASLLGCDSIINISLGFYPITQGNFDGPICTGSSITINGTIYDENNPTGTEVFPNAAVNGCDSTLLVNLSFVDEVIFDLIDTLCFGESLTINGNVYDESNPSGSETFPGGSSFGCDSIVTVQLEFYPESVTIIEETLLPGSSITINGIIYNQANPAGVDVIPNGSYTGCDSTIIVNILFDGEISIEYIANPPACEFGNDGSIIIESIIGGQEPYVVGINGGNSMPVVSFPVVFDNLDVGFYSLTVVDALGSIFQEDVFLPNPTPPIFELGDDIFLELGESTILEPSLGFTPASFLWEPDIFLDCTDCPAPLVSPTDDVTYTLTVTDLNGCIFEDGINIFVSKARFVYAPNAFSPNNDGRNDEFTLFSGDQVLRVNSLQIFDRWGALMFQNFNFEPNNLSIGWDGRHKGKMMMPGVYTWFAEIEYLDGEIGVLEGGVTLIR